MRSILAIVLLFCLALPILTTVLWFKSEQRSIKKAVKHQIIAGLQKTDLQLIKLNAADSAKLYWKHAKEFEFEGYMYDMVERKQQNDTTYYWCWKDYAETALEKGLREKVKNLFANHPDKESNSNRLHTFFKSLFTPSFTKPVILKNDNSNTTFVYQEPFILESSTNIPTPPPQV